MTLYLDTSVLVALLTNESGSSRVEAWVLAQQPEMLSISDWVITEVSSALSIKVRTKQISPDARRDALATFLRITTGTFAIIPVSSSHFRIAARFADLDALGLRAGDALHLALCSDHGATLCTLDRRLEAAARACGVTAVRP